MTDGKRVDLARRYKAAQHFAHLAASCEGSQEQFNLFHARGNHSLKIDRSQHGDRRHLRRRSSFSNGLLIALAQELPLGSLARRRDNWNDPQLLPQLGDGSQHGCFGNFTAQRVLQAGDCGVTRLKHLVSLHSELRYLARTRQLWAATPVAVAAECVHIRQNPACHDKIRLFTRLALEVEAHSNIGRFQSDQQLFGEHDVLGIRSCVPVTGYGLDKRWRYRRSKLPSREKETQTGLFDPGTGILKRKGPMSVVAHPFGARRFQLLCCQRKTSLPGCQRRRASLSPERRVCHLPFVSDAMEGPLDLLPRIQQSYWTSMRATRWVVGLGKF
jgi:hypothetical protein